MKFLSTPKKHWNHFRFIFDAIYFKNYKYFGSWSFTFERFALNSIKCCSKATTRKLISDIWYSNKMSNRMDEKNSASLNSTASRIDVALQELQNKQLIKSKYDWHLDFGKHNKNQLNNLAQFSFIDCKIFQIISNWTIEIVFCLQMLWHQHKANTYLDIKLYQVHQVHRHHYHHHFKQTVKPQKVLIYAYRHRTIVQLTQIVHWANIIQRCIRLLLKSIWHQFVP